MFIPNRPDPATLYDIENQYEQWYEEDDEDNKKDYIIIKIKKLFSRV